MARLVIHAPYDKARLENKKDFDRTLKSHVGDSYAITARLFSKLHAGCGVVLLDKSQRRRAEGMLHRLEPAGKAANGICRYHVHMKDLKPVQYKPERLNRNGVAVIP